MLGHFQIFHLLACVWYKQPFLVQRSVGAISLRRTTGFSTRLPLSFLSQYNNYVIAIYNGFTVMSAKQCAGGNSTLTSRRSATLVATTTVSPQPSSRLISSKPTQISSVLRYFAAAVISSRKAVGIISYVPHDAGGVQGHLNGNVSIAQWPYSSGTIHRIRPRSRPEGVYPHIGRWPIFNILGQCALRHQRDLLWRSLENQHCQYVEGVICIERKARYDGRCGWVPM